MISYAEIGPDEELWTYYDPENSEQLTFAASRLNTFAAMHGFQRFLVPVEEVHAQYCLRERGVEQDRLDRLREEDLDKPIMFAEWREPSERSHLMIDGTHRYVRSWQLGRKEIVAFMVPWSVAEQFLVAAPPIDPWALRYGRSGLNG